MAKYSEQPISLLIGVNEKFVGFQATICQGKGVVYFISIGKPCLLKIKTLHALKSRQSIRAWDIQLTVDNGVAYLA